MNMETAQTFVAWCPHHGIPLHEATAADGWAWCDGCQKIYRIIIKDSKVTVIEDDKRTYHQSAILRWHMEIIHAAKMQIKARRNRSSSANTTLA